MSNLTFTMVKPEAVQAGNTGAILNKIENAGFRVVAMKKVLLSKERAGEFYAVHRERPFYGELVDYMSSGPIIAAILEKDNAVSEWRNLMGATDSTKAEPGTIRAKYGTDISMNATHGSDSDENAQKEINFFFKTND